MRLSDTVGRIHFFVGVGNNRHEVGKIGKWGGVAKKFDLPGKVRNRHRGCIWVLLLSETRREKPRGWFLRNLHLEFRGVFWHSCNSYSIEIAWLTKTHAADAAPAPPCRGDHPGRMHSSSWVLEEVPGSKLCAGMFTWDCCGIFVIWKNPRLWQYVLCGSSTSGESWACEGAGQGTLPCLMAVYSTHILSWHVVDSQACWIGIFALRKMMSRTPFNAHTDPPGCIYRTGDRDIFFNSRKPPEEEVTKADRKPVCKGPVDSFGVSPKVLKPVAAWDQAWFQKFRVKMLEF